MDEIDALNEEWNRIRSRGLSTGGAGVTGYNSNSSDTNSGSKPRRKRSRWSNDAAAEEIKAPSNGSKPVTSAAQINFGDSVSKLVAERRDWEKTQIAAGVSKNQVVDRIAAKRETVAKQQLSQEPRRFPFGGHDEDELVTTEVSSSSSKQTRKYRHRNSSTSSESEAESQKTTRDSRTSSPSIQGPWQPKSPSADHQDSESQKDQESSTLGSTPFIERKTSVIVKELTDWVTTSHILQDVKSAQLRNFEDVGIVRKRARGNPYRYAYVDFGTQTSAGRWIQIRKGNVVIGSQQFKMEMTYRDWLCPKCQVLNIGKAVICFTCRDAKNVLLSNK